MKTHHRERDSEVPARRGRDARPRRLLGVFAHPDDETWCAGGTVAQWTREGAEVLIVSATRGEAGQIRDVRVADRRSLGRVREAELRLACLRLGAGDVRCWDYPDGTLAAADFEPLVDRVAELLRTFRPDVVVSFGSEGGYGHPDHIAIGSATLAAWNRTTDPDLPNVPWSRPDGRRRPRLLLAHFPSRDTLLVDRLSSWLTSRSERFIGSGDYVHALLLLCQEAGTMRMLRDDGRVHWYPPGTRVIEQGEESAELFVILSGTAEVWQQGDSGDRRRIRVLGPGEFFGELGVVARRRRSADVVAREGLTCLTLASGEPTRFASRGPGAPPAAREQSAPADARQRSVDRSPDPFDGDGNPSGFGASRGLIEVDVSDVIEQKVSALCAHRSQYALERDMFPLSVLTEVFGRECFIEVTGADGATDGDAAALAEVSRC